MSLTVEQELRVFTRLADLQAACFTDGMRVALVAWHPEFAERHLICGHCLPEDLAAVAKLLAGKMPPAAPFDAWSFLRDVLMRGSAVERHCEAMGIGYEQFSFRMDAAAREWSDKLAPHLAASAAGRAERVEAAIRTIIENWQRWEAEAGQAAQQEQHPDAGTDTLREFLRPVLERI